MVARSSRGSSRDGGRGREGAPGLPHTDLCRQEQSHESVVLNIICTK